MATAIETVYNGYRFRSRLEARWAVFFDTLRIPYEYEKEGYTLPPIEESDPWYVGHPFGTLRYLPDFWLPNQQAWIEIKPSSPSVEEIVRAHRLAIATQHDAYIFGGPLPYINPRTLNLGEEGDGWRASLLSSDGGGDHGYMWCDCPDCGALGVQSEGRSDRLPCKRCFPCDFALALRRNAQKHPDWLTPCPVHGDEEDDSCSGCDRRRYADPLAVCPLHGEIWAPGCGRIDGDKGYRYATPRLVAAYAAARQARFEWGETPHLRS